VKQKREQDFKRSKSESKAESRIMSHEDGDKLCTALKCVERYSQQYELTYNNLKLVEFQYGIAMDELRVFESMLESGHFDEAEYKVRRKLEASIPRLEETVFKIETQLAALSKRHRTLFYRQLLGKILFRLYKGMV
jgi:hypothetical protein